MSWGTELWDQFENISGHTQKGIEFCERFAHFIKERCAIENEYASRLKKLVKNYKPKKTEQEEEFTCIRGFYRMLNEVHDLAGQHESIAECLNASIFKELQTLIAELKADRRKYLHDGAKQQNALRLQLELNEKAKKQYEKAFKESEKAQENYKKADADIHLSRADVEKAKNLMHAKQQHCEQCKNEYALELQKTNNFQSDHYQKQMPDIFSQLQTLEENRVNRIQSFIKQSADIERRTIPIINTCLDGMVNAAESISAAEDAKIVIERYKSGFTPPGDIPFEDLSNGNVSENQNQSGTPKTMRGKGETMSGKAKKGRSGILGIFSTTKFGGVVLRTVSFKAEDAKEDFSHLPPNQQRKKLNEKIEQIKQEINKETAERDGMLKMHDVYKQNPNLGDPQAIEKQLEPNAQKLDSLKRDLQKYEGYLAEVGNRNLNPAQSRIGNSLSQRSSDASLSSSVRSSNPGTPLQETRTDSVDNQGVLDDSFEDQEDEEDEFEFSIIGSCVALYPFEAPNDGSIRMKEGEEFSVLEKDQGDGWTRVRRNNGEVGFVPTSYIRCSFN